LTVTLKVMFVGLVMVISKVITTDTWAGLVAVIGA